MGVEADGNGVAAPGGQSPDVGRSRRLNSASRPVHEAASRWASRFPQCMMASGVWAGASDIQKVHEVRAIDDSTASVKSELTRIGYLGSVEASWEAMPMAAHFELHIGKECSPSIL